MPAGFAFESTKLFFLFIFTLFNYQRTFVDTVTPSFGHFSYDEKCVKPLHSFILDP